MASDSRVQLLLFVGRHSMRSANAVALLRSELAAGAFGTFDLEIVSVFEAPDRALRERVLVTPTLLAPQSGRRLIGDLGDRLQLSAFLRTLPRDAVNSSEALPFSHAAPRHFDLEEPCP